MASPEWNIDPKSQMTFGSRTRVITPGAAPIDPPAKAVVMLAAGDITIVPFNSTTELAFVDVPAGYSPPYIVGKVTACSSSCATVD